MASVPGAVLFSVWLLLIAAWDARRRRIPHALTLGGSALALAWRGIDSAEAVFDGALGLLAGLALFGAIYAISQRAYGPDALGFGDVMLAGLIGAGVGLPDLLWALALGLLLTGAAAGILLASGQSRRSSLPFGPWLVAGALLVVWWRV